MNYIGKIVFNKLKDKPLVYYVVKSFDRDTLRIEHLKKKDVPDGVAPINLEEFRKKHINIAYYNKYDKK